MEPTDVEPTDVEHGGPGRERPRRQLGRLVQVVTILHVADCPNWRLAGERVRLALGERADVRVEHQLVQTAEQARELGFTGSPTILVDGVDPFAEPGRPAGLACRVYLTADGLAVAPAVEQLIRVLTADSTADPADSPQ